MVPPAVAPGQAAAAGVLRVTVPSVDTHEVIAVDF